MSAARARSTTGSPICACCSAPSRPTSCRSKNTPRPPRASPSPPRPRARSLAARATSSASTASCTPSPCGSARRAASCARSCSSWTRASRRTARSSPSPRKKRRSRENFMKTNTVRAEKPSRIEVLGRVTPEFAQVLSTEALAFVAELHRRFESRRQDLLAMRAERQRAFDAGAMPDFLAETRGIRESAWKVASQPRDLLDRRVEITGPTDRKMVINAMNCGASTFMADFEDANCPTWHNMIDGQVNLRDAVRRTISFESTGPDSTQKIYRLNDKTAILLPRPRGWHLDEKHVTIDGKPVSG